MNPGVQVFVYPEELEATGPRALAEQIRDLGCDAVSMAVVYHRARRVFPRHRRISTLTGTTAYLDREEVRRFRECCDEVGLRFRAWVVALHDERLASAQLVDGSPAGHSLCPSAPAAVEYVAALARDVAARLSPDAVDLEAAIYPAWEPSYTLTLALAPLSERQRLLASQCFCEHCGDELAERTRAAFWEDAWDEELAAELAARRARGVRRLLEATAAAVHDAGSELRVFSGGLAAQAALQGVSPDSLAPADAILLGCGPAGGDELAARFAALQDLVGGRPATVSTNWTPERDLAADARRLAAAGAEGLALYNLSLVPEEGLAAFAAAAAAFRA